MKRALAICIMAVMAVAAAAYAGPTISAGWVWFEGGTVIAPGMGYQPDRQRGAFE